VQADPEGARICRLPDERKLSFCCYLESGEAEPPLVSKRKLLEHFDDLDNFMAFRQVKTYFES
jgi:hypothetical protein